jgi:lambda repressor-like predicted transcriptional regulator
MDKKRKGHYWTSQQRLQLIEAQKRGVSLRYLAEFHGVSRAAIANQLRKGERDQFALIQAAKEEQWQRFKDINDNLFVLANIPPSTFKRLDRTLAFMRTGGALKLKPRFT